MNGTSGGRIVVVRDLLEAVWGDALPLGPQPWLTSTVEALGCDDVCGRQAGLVVAGDGLRLDVVRRLVQQHPDPFAAVNLLPPSVRGRLPGPDHVPHDSTG